ncbi:choice-of-anchor D domain-containing protein [Tengunoibacter tsumagoiensis]|uniref:Abnormal spindle-like microcephaly-associated protein ASH domain-containing protein n=1 Tax=Tengunoibacter tsumagoiensis TaxID=2014871 RepID=A0A402A689_9CHLR|nr:choice-of-anchor D domain-containing protein [Tengunoibacter tsumagoiensis]GCE14667.1 hypothetical protein KTT_45260 [Tengunoibacter tsumagoiensis]
MNLQRPCTTCIPTSSSTKGFSLQKWRFGLGVFTLVACMGGMLAWSGFSLRSAQADTIAAGSDNLQTGWYANQSGLTPDQVGGGTFGKLFSANVVGQVYAQPLVSQGTLLVATEMNNIYGLDPGTGSQKWTRNLGTPFNPADVTCSDLIPRVGITATPVVDSKTNVAYFTSKSYLNGTSGPAVWYMHAVSVANGAEQKGFPVQIQGVAGNDPTIKFDPTKQLQRPGLLLMNGVVYAAFGGHCDRKPYEGWIIGVSTAGKVKTLWTNEPGQPLANNPLGPGGGIWMPSSLLSDADGDIVFSSGNGKVPDVTAGSNAAHQTLAQSIVRLHVQADGSLKATDFFAPYDADLLNKNDSDVGSGGVVELPSQYFGTKKYPHVILQVGKQGYIYLLNADNLGGRGQGPNNSDAVINRVGPFGGVWGKPSVWPGNGGYVYITTAQGGGGSGKLKVFHSSVDGDGKPTLSYVGATSDTFGFGSSIPVITSSGVSSGSALVWVIWSPDGSGVGGQLRAYDPIPVNGVLHLRYSVPVGTATKYSPPGVDANHLYVGTRDGHVLGFGSPVNTPLSGEALNLGQVVIGKKHTETLTIKASTHIILTGKMISNPDFSIKKSKVKFPITLNAGDKLSMPVTFAPTSVGLEAANVTFTTSRGEIPFSLSGTGESKKGTLTVSPSPISFGGTSVGGTPLTSTTTLTNSGATPIKLEGYDLPNAPFHVSGLPASHSTLAPLASVTVTITFSPQKIGSYTSVFRIYTTGGVATVPLSGNAGSPANLVIDATTIHVGNVPVGKTVVVSFTLQNTGGSPLEITISKSPSSDVGFSAVTDLPEGTVIAPGQTLTVKVDFSPTMKGTAKDTWSFNSNDNTGEKVVTFVGNGVAA